MKIARILYPISELGPGKRIGVWVQGCTRACAGCANPELWDIDEGKEIPLDIVILIISNAIVSNNLNGITITGGEPFLQQKELKQLVEKIKPICNDILVYTGFKYIELKNKNDRNIDAILSMISVLVDGEYIKDQNKGERLRGSINQDIIYLDKKLQPIYEQYQNGERQSDNFIVSNGIISVGIHPQALLDEYQR